MRSWIKSFLQKKTPHYIKYFLIIKKYFRNFIKLWKKFIYELEELYFIKKCKSFSSKGLTYSMVIEFTFNECYNILKKLNIIFLSQIKRGCYRFVILDKDVTELYSLLLKLMKLGYFIEFHNNKEIIIFPNCSSSMALKKYIYKFTLIKIYKNYKNINGIQEFGSEISFELERWYENNGSYITDSVNNIQNRLSYNNLNSTREVLIFDYTVKQISELFINDKYLEKNRVKNIDIVYTWVDSSDNKWFEKKEKYQNINNQNIHGSSISLNRFKNRDELKYSLRSLEKYFSGYRKIFIVVDGQKPSWLKESKELIIIDHIDIFPDKNILPVFNSHAIETVLHRIEGLSEHYLYINDDIIFGRSVDVSLFFPQQGIISIFPSSSTYIPFEKSNEKLLPVDTAAINTRKLLLKNNIGFSIFKFKHTPLPQLKSLLFELEEMFLENILITRKNRFRNPNDISLTSSLLYNFSYFRNITTKSKIDYSYLNIGTKNYLFILKKITTGLRNKRPDVFCINDVENNSINYETEDFFSTMENFLPDFSKYEKEL